MALWVHKLASFAETAETIFMESFAGSGHEVLGQMSLFYDFVLTMRIGAFAGPSAVAIHLPILAHFCFLLELILFLAVGALDRFLVVRLGGGRRVRMYFVNFVLHHCQAPIFLHVATAAHERRRGKRWHWHLDGTGRVKCLEVQSRRIIAFGS